MRRIVERVRKLIALSGSPDEPEARTAALMACRLIREHNLHVDLSPGAARAAPTHARSRATRGPYTRARDLRGQPACSECNEEIHPGDGFLDADARPVHGDCVPRAERP